MLCDFNVGRRACRLRFVVVEENVVTASTMAQGSSLKGGVSNASASLDRLRLQSDESGAGVGTDEYLVHHTTERLQSVKRRKLLTVKHAFPIPSHHE